MKTTQRGTLRIFPLLVAVLALILPLAVPTLVGSGTSGSSVLAQEAPDRDSDGITDANDPCPDDPATACQDAPAAQSQEQTAPPPVLDSDGDGIADDADQCPVDPTNQCTAEQIFAADTSIQAHSQAPNPTKTAKPSKTPVPTKTAKPTQTPKPTKTTAPTKTAKPTQTPKPTKSIAPSRTSQPTQTRVPSRTPTSSLTQTPTRTLVPTTAATATIAPSQTPTASESASAVPTRTASSIPSSTPTTIPSETPTNTVSATATDVPTETATPSPLASSTGTATLSPTEPPTSTASPTATATGSPTDTPTETPSSTPTSSPTTPAPSILLSEVGSPGSCQVFIALNGFDPTTTYSVKFSVESPVNGQLSDSRNVSTDSAGSAYQDLGVPAQYIGTTVTAFIGSLGSPTLTITCGTPIPPTLTPSATPTIPPPPTATPTPSNPVVTVYFGPGTFYPACSVGATLSGFSPNTTYLIQFSITTSSGSTFSSQRFFLTDASGAVSGPLGAEAAHGVDVATASAAGYGWSSAPTVAYCYDPTPTSTPTLVPTETPTSTPSSTPTETPSITPTASPTPCSESITTILQPGGGPQLPPILYLDASDSSSACDNTLSFFWSCQGTNSAACNNFLFAASTGQLSSYEFPLVAGEEFNIGVQVCPVGLPTECAGLVTNSYSGAG